MKKARTPSLSLRSETGYVDMEMQMCVLSHGQRGRDIEKLSNPTYSGVRDRTSYIYSEPIATYLDEDHIAICHLKNP